MKNRLLFILFLIFGISNLAFAQTKTVTNADLEKFRQQRLAAEKDYRENYAKMGFPSPDELEKQIEQSRIERDELIRQIREEKRIEQENALWMRLAEIEAQIAYLNNLNSGTRGGQTIYSFGYAPFYSPYYGGRRFRHFNRNQRLTNLPLPNLANYYVLTNQYPYRNNFRRRSIFPNPTIRIRTGRGRR